MQAPELKAAMEMCEWIFDFFAIGYDYLASRIFNTEAILERLAQTSDATLRREITSGDGAIPPGILDFLGIRYRQWSGTPDAELETEEFCFRLLSVLWQIDRAALDLNYFNRGASKALWPKVRIHLQKCELRLNRDNARVITIKPPQLESKSWWRAATKAQWSRVPRGQHLDPLFKNIARVPEVLGATFALANSIPFIYDRLEREKDTFTIGVAPLISDIAIGSSGAELLPGPLRIVPKTVFSSSENTTHYAFTIEIDGSRKQTMDTLSSSAASVTQMACDNEVEILVFPELVVPDAVVQAIGKVLQDNAGRGTHTPRFTLAGSFGRPSQTGRHYNEAIVLDSNGGELYRQRKMHAYKMFEYEQEKYDLVELFERIPRQEDFSISPRQLTFFDSRVAGYRIVILICEDAAQPDPGGKAAAAWQATMILVPVMAGALEEGCWCWKTAESFASNPGAVTVVANSGALAKAQYKKKGDSDHPPLAILGTPLADSTYKNVRSAGDKSGTGLILFTIP